MYMYLPIIYILLLLLNKCVEHLALYELQQSVICTKTIPLESETSLLVGWHFFGNQFAEVEMKIVQCIHCFYCIKNGITLELIGIWGWDVIDLNKDNYIHVDTHVIIFWRFVSTVHVFWSAEMDFAFKKIIMNEWMNEWVKHLKPGGLLTVVCQ